MERSMSTNTNPWDEFEQELQTELDQSRRSLKEVTMMLEQSQAELTKLTQKNSMPSPGSFSKSMLSLRLCREPTFGTRL
jgi:hypothetical protein